MKHWLLIPCLIFVFGCHTKPPAGKVVVKIGDYVMTQEEFEDVFRSSHFALQDNDVSRRIFLDNMINQKIIILEAQAKGLDKSRDFLRMIQSFWEQSLLTVALREKTAELAQVVNQVSAVEIQSAYDQMVKDGKADKTLNDVYPQVKAMLIKKKESEKINQWVEELRRNQPIEIHLEYIQQGS